MWPTTVSFPSSIAKPTHFLRNPRVKRTEFKSPKLSLTLRVRASSSFFDFPLASRIIVRNLPYSTSERSLLDNFSHFGQIAEVKLVKDNVTKRSKGFAFIQFTTQDDAMLALETMDNQSLNGRLICVEIAKPGKDAFMGNPRTSSGPPKELPRLPVEVDETDCWY